MEETRKGRHLLTDADRQEIYRLNVVEHVSQKEIAARYDIHPQTVTNVVCKMRKAMQETDGETTPTGIYDIKKPDKQSKPERWQDHHESIYKLVADLLEQKKAIDQQLRDIRATLENTADIIKKY